MKKFMIIFVLLAIFVLSMGTAAANARGPTPITPQYPPAQTEPGEMENETPMTWFVELASPPAVEGTSITTLEAETQNFRKAAKDAGLEFTERYAFNTLFNGLSIKIDPVNLGTLTHIKGVKALYPVLMIDRSPVIETQPQIIKTLEMTGADIVQSELGFTGDGVKIGIIDSGIDYHHPDLGGCFGPGCKVAYGWDFVGDYYDGWMNPPEPDPDPDDCDGHGTHIAGIAAANGQVVGMAPGATLGSYRVFSCVCGGAETDIFLAAMEAALKDGMDILNLSWGTYLAWPQYPTAQAADRLVNAGMVVVASMGNGGWMGVYNAGAPAVGEKVIAVASFDNSGIPLPHFEANDFKVSYNQVINADPAPTSGTEEIVYIGSACNGQLLEADPNGKVAMVSFGDCWTYEPITNAQAAGAAAVVFQNNFPGNIQLFLYPPVSIPAVSISLEDGEFIKAQASPINITWSDQLVYFPNPTGGLISWFSSYGPGPDLSLKPDIGAPGDSIYSTYPLELGGYSIMGGTSMSAPHIAGAAALYLEAYPNTNPQVMRDVLQNSADPQPWSLGPDSGFLDHTFRQGAGLLDIDDSILATTRISPGMISLKEIEAGTKTLSLEIENKGETLVVYDLSYESAVGASGVFDYEMGFWLTDELVDFPANPIHIFPDESYSLDVVFTPPTGPDLGLYGGYIVFTPRDGGQVYRVPYAGFIGDYQELPVLDANLWGLPYLNPSWDGDYIFSMDFIQIGPNWYWWDIPELLVHFGHNSREVKIEIHDVNTGKYWGTAFEFDYFSRNSSLDCGNWWNLYFEGTTMKGKKIYTIPDGDYVFVINVLKALGDETNPAHWETWTSPIFTIDRP